MILPTIDFLFILLMVFWVESLPFLNTNFHSESVRRVVKNFDTPYADQYPSLRFLVRRSPAIFSGSTGSSIRQPALRLADTLRQIRERSSFPSRSMTSMNVAANSQYLNNFNQQFDTAEKIQRFGQRVRDSVQQYKKGRGKATQRSNELFDRKFNLGEAKDRLRQALLGKKALMDKLHSIGWRGEYVGVPYHTMNEEHAIVKKPGADFGLVSGSNVRVPFLCPVPVIEPIRPEHPVIPELTTSVQDSEQVSGIPAAADSFIFPITLTTEDISEAIIDNRDIKIANSIRNDKLTANHVSLNSLDETDGGGISTTPLMYTATGSEILELIADRIPFSEIKEPTEEGDVLFKTENEAVTDSTIDAETTTGIVSTLLFTPSTPVTLETDTSSSMPSTFQTTTPVDVLSRIRLDHDTNSVTDLDILSTEMPSTSSFISNETNFITTDKEFISSTIDADITTEILSNFSSDLATVRVSNDETTSSEPSSSPTNTISGEVSTIMDTVFTTVTTDSGSKVEFIPTMPSTIQTEIIYNPDEGSSIMDIPFANSMTDIETTTDTLLTYSTTEPSEITTSLNEMPAIIETHFASSDIDTRTTAEVTSTVHDFTVSIGTANSDETIATESILEPRSGNEVDTTAENFSMYSSTASFINLILDTGTTTEFEPTYFSTTPNKINPVLDLMFTTNTPLETSTIIETDKTDGVTSIIQDFTDSLETQFSDEISTTPATASAISRIDSDAITEDLSTYSTIEPMESVSILDEMSPFSSTLSASLTTDAETTTEIIPNYWDLTVSLVTANFNEISTTESIPITGSTNEEDTTTENISPFSSTESIELVSNFEEISTTTTAPFTSSALETETTTEFISTYSSTISKEITSAFDEIFKTSKPFTGLSTEAETTTEITPMVRDSIVFIDTPYFDETSTTIDVASPKPAIDIDTTIEYFSTHSSTWPIHQVSIYNEIVTTTNTPSASSTIDTESTTEFVSTYFSSVQNETSSTLSEIFETSTSLASLTTDTRATTEVNSIVQNPTVFTEIKNFDEISTTENIPSGEPAIEVDTTTEDFLKGSTERVSNFYEITETPIDSLNATSINLAIDTETTTDIVPPFFPTTANVMTLALDEISTTASTPSANSTIIALDTNTEAVSTYSSTIPTEKIMLTDTMSLVDADATDVALTSSMTYAEKTTDIVTTSSTIIPSESNTVTIIEDYDDEVQNFEDYETVQSNSENLVDRSMFRKLDSVSPQLDYTNEEEPDEKTLLNLIPLIITELKKDNLTPEEKETLSEGFGDLWPLMVEESKRKTSEPMNQNLAVYLLEAGQQLSPINGPAGSRVTNSLK